MSKLKFKFWNKIFTEKNNHNFKANNDFQKQGNNNQDYFRNVVPPLNNSQQKDNVFVQESIAKQQIYDRENMPVTSSYIIPLQEKQSGNDEIPSFINSQSYQQVETPINMNTMALISFKNNFKIPKPISREIKSEKLKQLLLCLISTISLITSCLFISFYFSAFNFNFIPSPVLTIPLAIISTAVLLINIIEFVSLKKEVDLYIERTLKGTLLPPNFIIRNYRKIHARIIILNWISIISYFIFGISIGIMFLISGQKLTFIVQSWTVNIPNITNDAITLTVILAIILAIHMLNIVIFKFRKRNIISYYGYEIINPQELNEYQKKINRICLIITLGIASIILFAIIIPIWIAKRRKKK